jgi:Alw26I/Eco31I/Esp3I family type II restriction m6 adenine DNA methyltransferase
MQGVSSLNENIRERLIRTLEAADQNDLLSIVESLSRLSESEAESQAVGKSTRQREHGIYYTDFSLARALVKEALRLNDGVAGSLLEPCVGGGSFLFAYIELLTESKSPTREDLLAILEKCFIADSDPRAVEDLLELIPLYTKSRFGHAVTLPSGNVFIGDSLLTQTESGIEITDLRATFKQERGFDFVITNPPYRLLKTDSRQGSEMAESIQRISRELAKSNLFKHSKGTPNIYKLFTEAIVDSWVADSGVVGLLIPRSLLTDLQSSKLRLHLLDNFSFGTILNLTEGTDYFKKIGQAFTAFAMKKGSPTRTLSFGVLNERSSEVSVRTKVDLRDLASITRDSALFEFSREERRTLSLLSNNRTVSGYTELVNLRGELDITLDKAYITDEPTDYKYLAGNNIGFFGFSESGKYVVPEFLNRPKGKWSSLPRLACHQIQNMNSKRRLKWTLIPPGYVLANSCNFISIDPERLGNFGNLELYSLLGVLNSEIQNVRFKLLSPNNHISNSEIASFPVGEIKQLKKSRIPELAEHLSAAMDFEKLSLLNDEVLKHFSAPSNRRVG